ncbi:hypothetical protein DEO72_LG4g909 [Vigna unguiculata]|uniref:Uncharacterized protein n=1 Tax=Vigna unguiculata TaxID=3917 RepID=A0A4D6LN01_VIGUN|nr:hypothetical protein DEO72_LG4g909 [Vigna unguiculata]
MPFSATISSPKISNFHSGVLFAERGRAAFTALMLDFGCSSVVELEPSLLSLTAPPFSASSSACSPSFPGNFKSSTLTSPSAAASVLIACYSVAESCSRREE